jgi:hypothetical protein
LVGAPGFEPGTPSPPDWCANRAALRSAKRTSTLPWRGAQGRARHWVAVALKHGYAASGRDIQRMSGIAGNTQPRPATT